MPLVKTSLTLDRDVTRSCQKIALGADVSFAKWLRRLMAGAVKNHAAAQERRKAKTK